MDVNTTSNDNKKRKANQLESDTSLGVDTMSMSITDAATHLHSLLQSKEKELKEREDEFTRKVNLYESKNPSLGKDNDVLQLNVGGTHIAVLRRTLTQFEDSVLAAQFSGRWDESMERDKDGYMFIDQDPENFLLLVNYLRLRMNICDPSKVVPDKHLPRPTYSFCHMVEYYGLMPGLYPQSWHVDLDKVEQKWIEYNTLEIVAKDTGAHEPVNLLCNFLADAGVSEFTVEFDKGSTGAVGWWSTDSTSSFVNNFEECVTNSIFLNVTERKVIAHNGILAENMKIDHMASTTKVICTHDGLDKYSIEVEGSNPIGVKLTKRLGSRRVHPMISFFGKATISNLKYTIDEL